MVWLASCRFGRRHFEAHPALCRNRAIPPLYYGGTQHPLLKTYNNLLVGFDGLHWRTNVEAIAVHVKDFEIFRCPHFEKKSGTEIKS